MPRKKSDVRRVDRIVLEDHMPVETGLEYWLEHVVHWYAFLVSVIAVLAVGYVMFGGSVAFASP